MPNVLAVVLSYHPDAAIAANINALLAQVSQIVIVDNESSEKSREVLKTFSNSKVFLIANDSNKGVATGFNQGMRWGLHRGFDYFLLLDQDSTAESEMVEKLLSVAVQQENENTMVVVGPNHDAVNEGSTFAEPFEEVALLITSGSLFSRAVVEKIGLYDERLFIDHVDHDFCLRLVRAGGKCLKVRSARLHQRFGAAKIKTILGKSFFLQEYSPFRRYHMMRNRIVLYKRYGILKEKWFWLDLRSAFKDFVKLVFFESGKRKKVSALIRGLVDGLRWKD